MTLAMLLLVVVMLVLMVAISIVQGIYVYDKLKSAKSRANPNITAHKGPLINRQSFIRTLYNLCMCVQHYSTIMHVQLHSICTGIHACVLVEWLQEHALVEY